MTPSRFHELVMVYCAAMRASETSGGRTTAHNAAVGGVPGSAHRFNLGRDVVYDELPDKVLASEYAARLGLRLIREGDHDHLQPLDWPKG